MRHYVSKCLGILLIVVVAVASNGDARAAVTVFDDFESYTAGADLNGNNGGTGWTSPWTAISAVDVIASEIDFGANDGGSQAVQLTGAGSTSGTGAIYREFAPRNDTFYVSTLIKTVDVSEGFHQFGFSDNNDHNNSLNFIVRWDDLDARVNSGGGGTASAVFADGQEHLIVAKISKPTLPDDFNAIEVYLDPKYSIEPATPTVAAGSSSIGVGTFDTFFMRDTFDGEIHFSNLTIGDSFADVVANNVVRSNFQQGVSPSASYVADSTYIRQSWPDTPQDGDAQDENIVGFNGSTDEMRGLFEFDLSDIQAWSDEVANVELVLTTRPNEGGAGSSQTVAIHEYGFDFVEADATWNDPAGDGSDTTVGGTLGTLLTSATFNPTQTGLAVTFSDTPEFRAAVAAALNSPDQTLRLLARQTSGGTSFARFQTEEFNWGGDLSGRPLLVVHMAVPEPSALLLACLGLATCGLIRRRQRH